MLVVRPAGPADLDHLLELAILSGPGFTSLPEDADQLAERLELGRDNIRTVRDARRLTVQIADEVEAELPALISPDRVGAFRAVRPKAGGEGETVTLNRETADALKVRSGDAVRVKT